MERALVEYVVNSVWQVPLIAVAAWVAVRIGRADARMQHWIWLSALASAVLLPAVPVPHRAEAAAVRVHAPVGVTKIITPTGLSVADDVPWIAADVSTVVDAEPAHVRARSQPVRQRSWRSAAEWHLNAVATRWVVALYLVALAYSVLRLLWTVGAAQQILRQSSTTMLDAAHDAVLRRCCEELGLDCPEVRVSARTRSPLVIGVRRAVLVLPIAFARRVSDCDSGHSSGRSSGSISDAEMEAVLWHEMVHVKRRDYLANLFCHVWSLPVSYHPALQMMLRRVRRTREMVCDATAAGQMSSHVSYARSLLEMAKRVEAGVAVHAESTALFGDGALEERVMELLKGDANVTPKVRALRAGASVATMLAVAGAAALMHVTPTLAAARQSGPEPVQPLVQPIAAVAPVTPIAAVMPEGAVAPMAAVVPVVPAAGVMPVEAQAAAAGTEALSDAEKARMDEQFAKVRAALDDAAKKMDSAEVQKRIAEAMEQAKKANSPEVQKKIDEAIAKAQAQLNSPEVRRQLDEVNSPEFKKRMEDIARQQADMAANSAEIQRRMQAMQEELQKKFNSPEWKKAVDVGNSPEFKERMEQMRRELDDAMKQLAEHQKQLESKPDGGGKPQVDRESLRLERNVTSRFVLLNALQPSGAVMEASLVPVGLRMPERPMELKQSQSAPDRGLYESGMQALKAGDYATARVRLQTLVNRYPTSSYVADAKRAIAQSWDAEGTLALVHADEEYQAAGVGAKKVGDGITAPVLVSSVNPEYTAEAKAAKLNGTVLVNLWVDEQGGVQHLRVLKGLGSGLDEKAVDAVRQYRFKPAMENGRPVMVAVSVEVNFRIF